MIRQAHEFGDLGTGGFVAGLFIIIINIIIIIFYIFGAMKFKF
jgi:hypothetical protein